VSPARPAADSTGDLADRLRSAIRDVPDFPRAGIVFKDLTPALRDGALLHDLVEDLARPFAGHAVTQVAAIEARGFLLGGAVAERLGAGLVPLRKPDKLPWRRERVRYDLEYGSDALEVHADALSETDRVLVVDDVLATGGTARAAADLVRVLGARVAGVSFLVELAFLEGRRKLGDLDVHSVLRL
jgi:adenine phosphoribosyltransferase